MSEKGVEMELVAHISKYVLTATVAQLFQMLLVFLTH